MNSLQIIKQETSFTGDKFDYHNDVKIKEYTIQVELEQEIDALVDKGNYHLQMTFEGKQEIDSSSNLSCPTHIGENQYKCSNFDKSISKKGVLVIHQ